MSQNDRVLAALRNGPVNPVQFAELPTLDGGRPILRLAARIGVLRDRGHHITSQKQSNGTVTYTLVRDAERNGTTMTEAQPVKRSAARSVSPGAPSPKAPAAARLLSRPPEPTLFDQVAA